MVAPLSGELKQFVAEHVVDRHNTNSVKWDLLQDKYGDANLLAMWVADMEFKAPQAVQDALVARAQAGTFGYSFTPQSYYDAFINWQKRRHEVTLQQDWIRFDTGVVNSLYRVVNWLTEPNEKVAVLQPVYYPFTEAIEHQGRKVVSVDLLNGDQGWQIDFANLEKTFQHEDIKLLLFCSPHNPVGRIWSEAELEAVLKLCHTYGVQLVSDEIHQDFEIGKQRFTSVLKVADGAYADQVIVLNAASKTFNLAALLNSHVIIPNEKLRQSYDAFAESQHIVEGSLLGQVATEAAYNEGEAWFDKLLAVIRYNYQYLKDTLAENVPEITVSDLQGTYLSYVDLAPIIQPEETEKFIQETCGLAVDYGAWFSPKDQTYIRLNLATSPENVQAATDRLVTQLKQKRNR
ncbi:pyridoxal phosphate-dependent aminotransferase [Lactobacillus sp. CC-MHH1034]|uniref:MalY/PatB family protein n=1 Tax=Agrilactobacillus fermenti TaxID=2586909 RepID=UPI001E354492|nr:MalY/PatB family protein [Agrilactobacillus fermenti]MCD2257191.1 pyridoxal phosphate-dependent aminotransferase [Agrilactobacillus fermenti]